MSQKKPLGCWQMGGLFLLLFWLMGAANIWIDSRPERTKQRQVQAAVAARSAAEIWAKVRTADPDGSLFVSYQLSDDGWLFVTVSNQWFALHPGVQEQTYDVLRSAWGQHKGTRRGLVYIVDVAGRTLR